MKVQICLLAVSLGLGAAMAQQAAPQTENKTNPPAVSKTMPAEMKTMTFKGVLVDMSCNTGDCPVKADSSKLGMKLTDGRLLKLDLVGTQRAQDELKNNKHWSKDVADNKPIHATVSGVVSGDKLIVSSIH